MRCVNGQREGQPAGAELLGPWFPALWSHLGWRQWALLTLQAPSASPAVPDLGCFRSSQTPSRGNEDHCWHAHGVTLKWRPAGALFSPAGTCSM